MARTPRRTLVAAVPSTAIERELDRRIDALDKRRTALRTSLSEVEEQMNALLKARGRPRRPARGARNALSLHAALTKLLTGREMGPKEAALAVQKAGYKTAATPWTFRTVVSQELSDRTRFRKVGKGVYTAR